MGHYQQLRRGQSSRPIRDPAEYRISGVRVNDSTFRRLSSEARKLRCGIATIARRVLEDWT